MFISPLQTYKAPTPARCIAFLVWPSRMVITKKRYTERVLEPEPGKLAGGGGFLGHIVDNVFGDVDPNKQ